MILSDYTQLSQEQALVCKQLQANLYQKDVCIISFENKEEKVPILFKNINNNLWTQQYIGIIKGNVVAQEQGEKIRKSETVVIRSRFDKESPEQHLLNYMFSKILDIKGKIFPDIKLDSKSENVWDILLMFVFIEQMKQAFKKGIYRQYQNRDYNDAKIKGKIDIARHIKENLLDNGKIAYTQREYTASNNNNMLLLKAHQQLTKKYGELYKELIKKESIIDESLKQIENIVSYQENLSNRALINKNRKPITHPIYLEYEPLRKTAVKIIKRIGLNIFEEENQETVAILININKLWEKFIYHTLVKDQSKQIFDYYKQKEFEILEGKRTIELDFYSSKSYVLDAKYRKAWEENFKLSQWNTRVREDVFQVLAYMLAMELDVGGVIFPVETKRGDKFLENDKEHLKGYKISDFTLNKLFYPIPYYIPKRENYKEFEEAMDYQIYAMQKKLKKILNNRH